MQSPGDKILSLLYAQVTRTPPVIIVGMHRSGTGLLVRLLESCGIYMGSPQTPNKESSFFQTLNRDLLDQLGVSWRSLEFLPETSQLCNHYVWMSERLDRGVKDGLLTRYWGWQNLIRQGVTGLWQTWGWKDPRNSLLLPVWQRVFPDASIIHIYRDGRDAALSVLTREMKRGRDPDAFSREDKKRRFLSDLALWEAYVRRIQEGARLFSNCYVMQYERLLSDPAVELKNVVQALGLTPPSSIEDVVSIIDPSRANQHEHSPEADWIRQLASENSLLKDLGYN